MKFNGLYKIKEFFNKYSKKSLNTVNLEVYFNEKNIDIELRNSLSENKRFKELLDGKIYLEKNIKYLKSAIEIYSQDGDKLIELLKSEIKLNEELKEYINNEINKVAGYKIEDFEYNAKEYTIKDDLKLQDGSFIKEGTSFFIEGFKNGEFEVHFEARADNTYIPNDGEGSGYYFSEHEIAIYSDLDKTVDLVNNDNMKLDKNNIDDDIKEIISKASKKAEDHNNKLEKKEEKLNEKEL